MTDEERNERIAVWVRGWRDGASPFPSWSAEHANNPAYVAGFDAGVAAENEAHKLARAWVDAKGGGL